MGYQQKKYQQYFPGITLEDLFVPSYGAAGHDCKNSDAIMMQKRLTNAIAPADLAVPRSVVARRISRMSSVAIQNIVAYNSLDYRYSSSTKKIQPGGCCQCSVSVSGWCELVDADPDVSEDETVIP